MNKVFSLVPVNKITALVVSKGISFDVKIKKGNMKHSENFIETITVGKNQKNNPFFIDLTGFRFGWFTVVGFYKASYHERRNKPGLWVCKCACGNYETRRKKSILNKNNIDDKCLVCRKYDFIKNKGMKG